MPIMIIRTLNVPLFRAPQNKYKKLIFQASILHIRKVVQIELTACIQLLNDCHQIYNGSLQTKYLPNIKADVKPGEDCQWGKQIVETCHNSSVYETGQDNFNISGCLPVVRWRIQLPKKLSAASVGKQSTKLLIIK